MTPRIKLFFAIAGILVIVTVLRETGVLDLNLYKSDANSSSDATWTSVTFDNSKPKSKTKNTDLSIVVLFEKDTLYKEINRLSPIVVTIDSLNTGWLWMPLYKTASFSAVGIPGFDNIPVKNAKSSPDVFEPGLSGRLAITGKVIIKGFCSHREAVNLIKGLVVQNFTAESKKYFASVSPEYLRSLPTIKMANK
jgi:hypothetical protein